MLPGHREVWARRCRYIQVALAQWPGLHVRVHSSFGVTYKLMHNGRHGLHILVNVGYRINLEVDT